MSKRLLFFTDNQVVYACQNTEVNHEAYEDICPVSLDRLPGSLLAWVLPYRWDLTEAHDIITQYSTRHLSFEKDALDAITGIWGMFEKHNPESRHVFGMPFSTRSLKPSRVYLSLPWTPKSPAVRRLGFPSWSFLGWNGAVEFKEGVQQLSYHKGMIEVFEMDRWHPLESLLKITSEKLRKITASMSPLLKVNAIAAEFTLEYITWNHAYQAHDGYYLILPWTRTYELCIEPRWDDTTLELDECDSLLCVVHIPELAWDAHKFLETMPYLLILRSFGGHYQRIGCCDEASERVRSLSDPPLHYKQFRTKQTKQWAWQQQPLAKDSQHLNWANKMKRKTFLLG